VAYADAVRRDLDNWLESIANVANETGSETIDTARHEDANIKTARLFDDVAVTGLLFCIAESSGLGRTTE
jgi:RecA-family ATPase